MNDGDRAQVGTATSELLRGDITTVAVDAIVNGLRDELLEVYVPEYFAEIAHRKGADPPAFLAGTAQYVIQQRQANGS